MERGSACAFFSSILKKEHMRVGTFVSPHLVDFEERITVDGRMIPKEDVTRLGSETEPFEKPAFIGREVTGDVRYYNSQLMKHPYAEWKTQADGNS